jgi:hypothetical protein
MADEKHEAARKLAAENREAREKAREHHNSTVGKSTPTPTQEEHDLAKLGAPPHEHEDDGSGPDPHDVYAKQVEANKPGGGYSTRQATPARAGSHTPHTPVSTHRGSE